MYCKHCGEELSRYTTSHNCSKRGLLNVDEGDSFLVSTLTGGIIGSMTDSSILGSIGGSLLGGDVTGGIIGGVLGDLLDGDLFD